MSEQTRRAARLLEIERLLRQRPGGMTASQLGRELGFSSRTIQRDIAVLESELRVPLVQAGRRYQILAGSHPLAPVRLTLQESRALMLAMRLFFRYSSECDPDGAAVLEKIATTLPEHIARTVRATAEVARRRPHKKASSEVMRGLTEAWANSKTVTIEYRSHDDQSTRVTRLDPYLLEPGPRGAGTYVIGFSHKHDHVRTFKVDRISHAESTGQSFEVDETIAAELIGKLHDSWGIVFGDERHPVVIEFSPQVAERVRETNWHPSQQLTPTRNGGVRMEMELPHLMEVGPWIRTWGADAIVIAPPALRDEMRQMHERAVARYAEGSTPVPLRRRRARQAIR